MATTNHSNDETHSATSVPLATEKMEGLSLMPQGEVDKSYIPSGDSGNQDGIETANQNASMENSQTEASQSDCSVGEQECVERAGGRNVAQSRDLCEKIQRQIEYYFSNENYWNDQYLLSQRDGDQFVTLATLASFPAVKNLTGDMELIRTALRSSTQLEMDPSESKVRTNSKRCVLLLRDIPDATPQEEVEALFQGEGVPDVKGRVEYNMNNNWMVRFDTEADTASAYQFVINKTFNGKPIYPRIKSASTSQPNSTNTNELAAQFNAVPAYDQFSMYNMPTIPIQYLPNPVPAWSPLESLPLYNSYLKPVLFPRIIPIQRFFPSKLDYLGAPVTKNGASDYIPTSPPNLRHQGSSSSPLGREEGQLEGTHDHFSEGHSHGEGRGGKRKGKSSAREDKKTERIPTPKMDSDTFPPLPTSPGNHISPWNVPGTQTIAEPTNKTLSDIVRKGQTSVSSPQLRHSAANPPMAFGRGRGRCEVVGEGVGERTVYKAGSENTRPLGRGKKPKSLSTSDTSQSAPHSDNSRSRSESGDKDVLKCEKLSYAQMAQKLPPPPPPPLPEAANYLPPSPTQPESPCDTFDHSDRHSFYKDNSVNLSNGYLSKENDSCKQQQDMQDQQQVHRKHNVSVSNGTSYRSSRGSYGRADTSKLHKKGAYSNSKYTFRERRAVYHNDRDNFKEH